VGGVGLTFIRFPFSTDVSRISRHGLIGLVGVGVVLFWFCSVPRSFSPDVGGGHFSTPSSSDAVSLFVLRCSLSGSYAPVFLRL